MRKVLEVIVASVAEAIEAEAGGADRLELVRDLSLGGLTPDPEVITAVLEAVRIPVRVMLRNRPSMCAGDPEEVSRLQRCAEVLGSLPIDGIVAGFVRDAHIERCALQSVISAAPHCRFTFHRAFEDLPDPHAAIAALKEYGQIDRILTSGGHGDWSRRKSRLLEWQRAAGPQITLLVGAGLSPDVLIDLANTPELLEVHIGRAARADHSVSGAVQRDAVRALRTILQ